MASLVALYALVVVALAQCREFKIDYANDRFLKDGQPFQYASGSIHYFRVPPEYWRDRLLKLRAAGLNTLQTYVAWNVHEPYPDKYNFENEADLIAYLTLAQNLGLYVILRPGPFIDAELDMGGLPWWLLKEGSDKITLRSSDPKFLVAVERWFSVLLPRVRPLLYANGGPILSVQVENEYGSYFACDRNYTVTVRNLLRQFLGDEVVLFTTDGDNENYMKCGVVDDVYATVDFGPKDENGVRESFAVQRNHTPAGGPLVNSEYYPGWFDTWGGRHDSTAPNVTTDTIRSMWNMNASFNVYLFHGGTTFGYWAGAELTDHYFTVTTSYDYNAPVTEAGDLTPKWEAIRQTMAELTQTPKLEPVPLPIAKIPYGRVDVKSIGTILDLLSVVAPNHTVIQSKYPLTMEQIDHPYGFILYETKLKKLISSIHFDDVVHDRAYVIIDGQLIGKIDRENSTKDVVDVGDVAKINSVLQILIENRGRICYGKEINDSKGLVGNVTATTLGGDLVLENWKIYPIDLGRLDNEILKNQYQTRHQNRVDDSAFIPTVYVGFLNVKKPPYGDTFLNPRDWSKGQAFINGRNLGRYWPVRGPQTTLYVPGSYLSQPQSTVMLFELDGAKCGNGQCSVWFVDKHVIQ